MKGQLHLVFPVQKSYITEAARLKARLRLSCFPANRHDLLVRCRIIYVSLKAKCMTLGSKLRFEEVRTCMHVCAVCVNICMSV